MFGNAGLRSWVFGWSTEESILKTKYPNATRMSKLRKRWFRAPTVNHVPLLLFFVLLLLLDFATGDLPLALAARVNQFDRPAACVGDSHYGTIGHHRETLQTQTPGSARRFRRGGALWRIHHPRGQGPPFHRGNSATQDQAHVRRHPRPGAEIKSGERR